MIQSTGTMEEVGAYRDQYIESAIADNTLEGIQVDQQFAALNVFEKAMWVIKVTKTFLDDIEIKEQYWNSEKESENPFPFTVPDPLAGGGNVAIDELKSIPEMIGMGAAFFDPEQRKAIVESVLSLDLNAIKEGLSGMFKDQSDNYTSDNSEKVVYQ